MHLGPILWSEIFFFSWWQPRDAIFSVLPISLSGRSGRPRGREGVRVLVARPGLHEPLPRLRAVSHSGPGSGRGTDHIG